MHLANTTSSLTVIVLNEVSLNNIPLWNSITCRKTYGKKYAQNVLFLARAYIYFNVFRNEMHYDIQTKLSETRCSASCYMQLYNTYFPIRTAAAMVHYKLLLTCICCT